MTPLVPLTMYGWIPFCLVVFSVLPARRALIACFLAGWLFLPIYVYPLSGLPDYDKTFATILGVLIGVLAFNSNRLSFFQAHWTDLPIVLWCISPLFSSLDNGLGLWDGLSAVVHHVLLWGVPYFLGRCYFTTHQHFRELAMAIFISGLVYMPLCLWEWRMSPQLHRFFFGFHQHEFIQAIRAIGYRPLVFMPNGLVLSMWMMVTAMCGLWLWLKSFQKYLGPVPMWALVLPLLGTTVLCQSMNAIGLLAAGLAVMLVGLKFRTSLPLMALMLVAPIYTGVRSYTDISMDPVVEAVAKYVSPERSRSVLTRFQNEDALVVRAKMKSTYGWGRWGRSRIRNYRGEDVSKTDGAWIIAFGQQGLFGLGSFLLMFMMPVVIFWKKFPPRIWSLHTIAPALVMTVIVALFSVDNLLNNSFPPIILMAVAGLVNLPMPEAVVAHRRIRSSPTYEARTRFV